MKKLVSVIMGSSSDLETVKEATKLLSEFKIGFEVRVLSAHRTPKELIGYVESATKKGFKVFIAAAGQAAALPGVVASHTHLPVIGIPIDTKVFKGVDSLLSIIQMPGGISVGCMGIGKSGAKNAAILAAEILALSDKKLDKKIRDYRKAQAKSILKQKIRL
jgi:5-(carboxyamino)imidazole ribonucleotide mutase